MSMTIEQQQWVATIKSMVRSVPTRAKRPPENGTRRLLYRLVNTRVFDGIVNCVIAANVMLMACNYWGIEENQAHVDTYLLAMDCFCYFYYAEAVLKLVAFGPTGYFSDHWCRFDFFLVCMALLDQFATELLATYLPMPPMLLRVLRVIRILRILRLLKGAKELRNLIVTMVLSTPSLVNVAALLALIVFIYSCLGVHLFTYVAHGGFDAVNMHGYLTPQRNFYDVSSTGLLLFQCITGDGWAGLMSDAMLDPASGHCTLAAGDCGSPAAVPYFISFQLISSFIFLNLIVAVILDNFATLHNARPELVSSSDLENFSEVWSDYDPDATNFIAVADLPYLLQRLPPPLGLKGQPLALARRRCLRLDALPRHEGGLAFHEVISELVQFNYFQDRGLNAEDFKPLVEDLNLSAAQLERALQLQLVPIPGRDPSESQLVSEFFALQAIRSSLLRFIGKLRQRAKKRFDEERRAKAIKGMKDFEAQRRAASSSHLQGQFLDTRMGRSGSVSTQPTADPMAAKKEAAKREATRERQREAEGGRRGH